VEIETLKSLKCDDWCRPAVLKNHIEQGADPVNQLAEKSLSLYTGCYYESCYLCSLDLQIDW
jgi:hypothetical protein